MINLLKILVGFLCGVFSCIVLFVISSSPYTFSTSVSFIAKNPTPTPTPFVYYVQVPVSPLAAPVPIPIPPTLVPCQCVFLPKISSP